MNIALTLTIQKTIECTDDNDFNRQWQEIKEKLTKQGWSVNLESDEEV